MFGTFTWDADSLTFNGTGLEFLNVEAVFKRITE